MPQPKQQPVKDVTLEDACRAHHIIRTQQGFTTASWDDLEERNREQYRDAMRAAHAALTAERDGLREALKDTRWYVSAYKDALAAVQSTIGVTTTQNMIDRIDQALAGDAPR